MAFACAVLFAAAAAASAPAPSGPPLSLRDAVNLALTHAFSARIASYREASASAKVGEAWVAFLPDVTGVVVDNAYQNTVNSNYVGLKPPPTPGATPFPIPSSELHGTQTEADINAQYVLLSSTRRLNLKAAQLARDSQRNQTENARRQVIRDTARAYLQVVQADALLRLADQDVARRRQHLDEASALVKAGKRAEYEVIRAEADLAASEASLVDAKNQARVARSTLAQTVGTSLPLDFAAEPPAPPVDPRKQKPREAQADMIQNSLQKRPDVESAEYDATAAQVGVEQQRRAYLPSLSLFARYTKYPSPASTDLIDSSWTYGGQLTIRFSDMLTNAYRERDARAQAHLQAVVADQTRVAVSLDVERAMLEVDRATEVQASQQKALDAAQRNYDSVAARYHLGVATQTEQIDAEAALVEVETNAAKADIALRTALWNLRYEMGEPLDVE